MATYDGRTSSSISKDLAKYPGRFDFYQAVRLLASAEEDSSNELDWLDRNLEFKTETGNQFHASDIASVELGEDRSKVAVASFGLAGPLGPLPSQISEWFNAQERSGQKAMQAFLNIFEHRFVALLYLIKHVQHEGLHSGARHQSSIYRYLHRISGLPRYSSKEKVSNTQHSVLLPFAGLLAGGRCSVASVSNILTSLLNTKVEIDTQNGAFVTLDVRYQARLSSHTSNDTVKSQSLGDHVALGGRVWDQQNTIRIAIGPVGYEQAEAWLPETLEFDKLADLLRYVGDGRSNIELIINVIDESVSKSDLAKGMRLGLNSWLKSNDEHADQIGIGGRVKQTKRTIRPNSLN